MKKSLVFVFAILFLVGFVGADNSTNDTELPDLIITNITIFDRDTNQNLGLEIITNQGNYIYPTIKNIGEGNFSVSNLKYSVVYDPVGEGINLLMNCGSVHLVQNEEYTCTPSGGFVAVSSNGIHELKLKIDYEDILLESNEENNEFRIQVLSTGEVTIEPLLNDSEDDGSEENNNSENEEELEIEGSSDGEIETEFENERGQKIKIKEKSRFRLNANETPENCEMHGSVLRCQLQNGTREMNIFAGKSGNMIFQSKGINMSTKTELFQNEGKLYTMLKDNSTRALNYLPDQIRERIREQLKVRLDNESFEIELDDEGIYRTEIKKEARLFGFIKVQEKVKAHVNPETGEFVNINNPWWGFLANDVEEEFEEEPEELTNISE